MTAEAKPLVICTTARSGSNLLSDYLNNTGLFGWVAEYFNPKVIRSGWQGRKFAAGPEVSIAAYVDFLSKTAAGAHGRWGAKLLYEDAEHLIRFPAMQEMLKSGAIVFLRRRAKLSQAISYFLAISTGKWVATDAGHAAPEDVKFDYAGLGKTLNMLAWQEATWTTLFSRLELDPLEVIYEDLIADPAGTIAAIAAKVGLAPTEIKIRTNLRQQKSDVNADFAKRFNAQKWASMDDARPTQYGGLTFKA